MGDQGIATSMQKHTCVHMESQNLISLVRRLEYSEMKIDGLVQDCSNSIALAMELLQSFTKS